MLLFQHRTRKVRRTELRSYWQDLAARLGKRPMTCLVTDDEELRRLNKQFRGKDYATDVLSFPEDGGGEIAISFDRAVAQAAEMGHSVEAELRILMLHGALHLTGMDHEQDNGEMRRAEERWRKKLGLPVGLIRRVGA
ncbi:MAG: rRNA maturation RNase YbeY [Acidobacteriota bacterium]